MRVEGGESGSWWLCCVVVEDVVVVGLGVVVGGVDRGWGVI